MIREHHYIMLWAKRKQALERLRRHHRGPPTLPLKPKHFAQWRSRDPDYWPTINAVVEISQIEWERTKKHLTPKEGS